MSEYDKTPIRIDDELSYYMCGNGPLLILVCTLSGTWTSQVRSLSERYTIVTYDMRGFGESRRAASYVSNEQHADDLSTIVQHVDMGKPVIVGLSHGGIVLQHFARKYGQIARGFMLVATLAKAIDQTKILLQLLDKQLTDNNGESFWNILKIFLISEQKQQWFLKREKSLKKLMFNQFTVDCLHNIYSGALMHDATEWLGKVSLPCWIVSGKHDVLFPRQTMEQLTNVLPFAKLIELDCAHLPPVEAAQEFNQLLIEFADLLYG